MTNSIKIQPHHGHPSPERPPELMPSRCPGPGVMWGVIDNATGLESIPARKAENPLRGGNEWKKCIEIEMGGKEAK